MPGGFVAQNRGVEARDNGVDGGTSPVRSDVTQDAIGPSPSRASNGSRRRSRAACSAAANRPSRRRTWRTSCRRCSRRLSCRKQFVRRVAAETRKHGRLRVVAIASWRWNRARIDWDGLRLNRRLRAIYSRPTRSARAISQTSPHSSSDSPTAAEAMSLIRPMASW